MFPEPRRARGSQLKRDSLDGVDERVQLALRPMRFGTYSFVRFLALAGFAACRPAPEMAAPARQAVADTVRAAMNAYMVAAKTRDPALTAVFYAAEPEFRVYSGSAVLTYDSVIALERRATRSSFDGAWESLDVMVLTQDSAVAEGRFWQVLTDSTGRTQPSRGTATWTWVRRSAGWRVIQIRATTE